MEELKDEVLDLNIILAGDRIEKLYIQSLFAIDLENKEEQRKPPYQIENYEVQEVKFFKGLWKYFFPRNAIKKNESILTLLKSHRNLIAKNKTNSFDFQQLKNVIVYFSEDKSESYKDLIEFLNDEAEIYDPFIIIVSKDQKLNTKKVRDEMKEDYSFDRRNVEGITYDSNDSKILFYALWRKCCCFNELGNVIQLKLDEKSASKEEIDNFLNFIVIRKPGTGKSTFINLLVGEKVAREGKGSGGITKNIQGYKIGNSPAILWDTPGFGIGNEIEKIKTKVIKLLNNLLELLNQLK